MKQAFQDCYPDELSQCFGCGKHNMEGHQLKSYWDGDESVAHFTPSKEYMAVPGFVYGGLIASLIDCHSTGTASAAAFKHENREMGSNPPLRFVTASLHVDYVRPTPLGPTLEIRGWVEDLTEKKVVVITELIASGDVCCRGRVVAVKMPDTMSIKS